VARDEPPIGVVINVRTVSRWVGYSDAISSEILLVLAGHEAWPARLATRTGRVVYSMAHAGYGPVQYEHLLPESFALRPQGIIIGFYMGNDFADAYRFARKPLPSHLASLVARAALLARTIRAWLGEHFALYRFAHHVRRQLTAAPEAHDRLAAWVIARPARER